MAKDGGSKKAPKKQRWYKVLGEAYRVAKRTYPWARWALLGAAAAGAAIGVVPAIATGRWITWGIFAVLFAFILPMITLTRMVRTASYKQIDGMPGAVSAVLDRIRRGWTVQAEPVRFNARSQDMVIKRVAPNAPVHVINVGNDEGQTRLIDLNKAMRRLPRGITSQEVAALARRLEALSQKSLPIPKGIDPYKARPDRRAMRGK